MLESLQWENWKHLVYDKGPLFNLFLIHFLCYSGIGKRLHFKPTKLIQLS
jgi:hypothetical protein